MPAYSSSSFILVLIICLIPFILIVTLALTCPVLIGTVVPTCPHGERDGAWAMPQHAASSARVL